MRDFHFRFGGWFLGLCLLIPANLHAQTPVPAAKTDTRTYLHIQTPTGKQLTAPIQHFKGLSFGVIATLVKEGKMKSWPGNNPDQSGNMTFYLDKDVSVDFTNWAQTASGQDGNTSGDFEWKDPHGKATETFNMSGLKVVSYTPAGRMLILAADKTIATPPINFNPPKK